MIKLQKYFLVGIFAIAVVFILIRGSYKNTVVFTGDEWDYQSIGVNYMYGHDFLITGLIEKPEIYRISCLDKGKLGFWKQFSGVRAIYRSPFYPAFICAVYKCFGINPVLIKYFQLILLFISGGLLIVIAKLLWKDKGIYIGGFAFLGFILLNYKYPQHLMPETWQFLFLHLVILCSVWYYRGHTWLAAAAGIILGISALNKGTTFFLFPLIIACDSYYALRRKRFSTRTIFLFVTGFIIVTGTWSMVLSANQHRFIYISTQGNEVLLDGNNEFCTDGLWHPEWREHEKSYYYHDHMENSPAIFRVVHFYMDNPGHFRYLPAKFVNGFFVLPSFILMLVLSMLIIGIRNIFKIKKSISVPIQFIVVFLNFIIFTLLFYVCNETYPARYVKTMDGVFLLTASCFLFWIVDFTSLFIKDPHHEKKREQENQR